MKIRLIWTGKTKEGFIAEGIRKYLRLLRPYAEVVVTEIREEKGTEIRKMVEREGERILALQTPYILLDERGKEMTSLGFAAYIAQHAPRMTFVLGGPYGVSAAVREKAEDTVAISRMTFTHEMARLFFLEQTYRAFTIQRGRGYHH